MLCYRGYYLHAEQDGLAVSYEMRRPGNKFDDMLGFSHTETEAEVLARLRQAIDEKIDGIAKPQIALIEQPELV